MNERSFIYIAIHLGSLSRAAFLQYLPAPLFCQYYMYKAIEGEQLISI